MRDHAAGSGRGGAGGDLDDEDPDMEDWSDMDDDDDDEGDDYNIQKWSRLLNDNQTKHVEYDVPALVRV